MPTIWQRFSLLKINKSRGVIIISGLELLVIIIICFIIDLILSAIYKNEPKVDKGFVIAYYKLTYRRRMMRVLWTFLYIILCLIIIYTLGEWSTNVYIIFTSVCIIGAASQFFYNFYMWKKYEQGMGGEGFEG